MEGLELASVQGGASGAGGEEDEAEVLIYSQQRIKRYCLKLFKKELDIEVCYVKS